MSFAARLADLLDPPNARYRHDLPGWVRDRIGGHLWSKQREIAEAIDRYPRVAVKACHGPGKSWTAAQIVAHWIDTHPPGDAFAVTSAPTDPQVKAILWREITKAHKAGDLPGRVTLDAQWKVDDELVAFGRKPADHDEHGFQGIHARYLAGETVGEGFEGYGERTENLMKFALEIADNAADPRLRGAGI